MRKKGRNQIFMYTKWVWVDFLIGPMPRVGTGTETKYTRRLQKKRGDEVQFWIIKYFLSSTNVFNIFPITQMQFVSNNKGA